MSGTIIFRPIQGKFTVDKDFFKKMDPYCIFTLGHHKGKSYVAKNQGKFPYWNDAIEMKRKHGEGAATLTVKDKDTFTRDDLIGETMINIDEVVKLGKVGPQWFPVYEKKKLTGEVLLQIDFIPDASVAMG